jgi:GMP synthase (glutamine-hydrolysing)
MVASEQEEYEKSLAVTGSELVFVSSLDTSQMWRQPELMLDGIQGVIIGGSGEFDFDGGRGLTDTARTTSAELLGRLTPFIDRLFEHDTPLLGICYGHQMIALARGGKVSNDTAQKKVGSHEVSLTAAGKDDRLFSGLPDSFVAQYGHKDSITEIPSGVTVLVKGGACEASALRYSDRIYTLQFHPELTAKDVERKLRMSPGYLPEGVDTTDLIRESPEASSLLPRFVERIVRK